MTLTLVALAVPAAAGRSSHATWSSGPVPAAAPPSRGPALAALTGSALLLVGTAYGLWWYLFPDLILGEIEAAIVSLGPWGVAASVGLMVLHSFVPFPAELLALANGMIYGPFWGTVITWTGAMLGAFAAFGLAHRFGRPLTERLVARRHLARLDGWAERGGWRALLV